VDTKINQGGSAMNIIRKFKPPCKKCPVKTGSMKIDPNPCSECIADGYKFYDVLVSEMYIDMRKEN